jgi:hypothetical protein
MRDEDGSQAKAGPRIIVRCLPRRSSRAKAGPGFSRSGPFREVRDGTPNLSFAALVAPESNEGGKKHKRPSVAEPQPNLFGLRREAKRHAALEALSAVEKRCRRCALPPQSKILAAHNDSDLLHCKKYSTTDGHGVKPRGGHAAIRGLTRMSTLNVGCWMFPRRLEFRDRPHSRPLARRLVSAK